MGGRGIGIASQLSQLASNANNYQSKLLLYMCRGVHPSEAMMHICLCFRFPPIFDKFSDCGKFPKCYLFPKIFPIFIRQNF